MSQRPIVYVQQRSGCGQVALWLLVIFIVIPVICCLGQTILGLLVAEPTSP